MAFRAHAEALLYSGEYRAAGAAYERACSSAEAAGEYGLLGQILVGRIGTLQAMGEFGPIQAMARQAEALLGRSGDEDYLRRLHINLGSGHFHRERYAEAEASLSAALGIMEKAGQRDEVWASLTLNHGIALSELARVAEARRAFQAVEDYGRAHGHVRLAAQAMFNQGVLEGLRGGYRAALRYLADAEETFRRQETRELMAATHLEQAQIYLDLAMPAEGRDLAREAAASFEAEGMLLDANLARMAEAKSLLHLGQAGGAIEILRTAERFYRARRIRGRHAEVLLDLARAMADQGAGPEAMRAAGTALRAATRLDLRSLHCACRCFRAEIYLRRGRSAAAERELGAIRSWLPRLPMRYRLAYWSAAARVARAAGHHDLALRRYRRAIACLEAQRALIPGLELRARSFEQDVRIYHEKIALVAAAPGASVERLLALMERARGRTFRELLAARGTTSDEIAERRAVLGSMVRRLDHVLLDGPRRGEAGATTGAEASAEESSEEGAEAADLARQILVLEREITAHARRLDTAPHGVSGRGALRRIDQLVPHLAPDEVLIEYFVTEDRILAAVVSRQRQFLRTLELSAGSLRGELEHLRLQMEALAATANRTPANLPFLRRTTDARLRRIFAGLVEPLLGDIPAGGRLTVVPHDLLHQVPFECLHDGSDYVDRTWLITRCPTADFLIARRARPEPTAPRGTIVIAGTRPGSPFIEEEARGVLGSYEPAASRLLVDPSPDEALAAMRDARIIHVSAHGSFRGDNPLFSTLHLGPGALFLADILSSPLAAELAVVSACNSGQTFSGRGDALLGVAHAFLAAGARCLVASLWRVHDQATADWMQVFHRAWQETPDAAVAQRRSAQTVRETWEHPFYWGSFCVLGA